MLPIGSKVEIYWNLHKACYSVRHKGKVVMHTMKIALKDVSFSVQPAGRQKVLKEKVKNVHAFVRGTYCGDNIESVRNATSLVTYNPYKYDSFVNKVTNEPVYAAECVLLSGNDAGVPQMLASLGE